VESTLTASDPVVNLVFTGDIMLGRLVNRLLREKPPEYPWGDTIKLVRDADWRCANLECVFSDGNSLDMPNSKLFRFRSDPANVAVLETVAMSVVSLANNHTLDFGRDAMLDMLRILNQAGVTYGGAGANLEEASRPSISAVKGMKIALLSFTDNEPAWEATARRAGVFYVPLELENQHTEFLLDVIRMTRAQVDFVVVSAHWGSNWSDHPPPAHTALAHRMIDAGASLIFGHSAHVFRGIELYRGCPIFYSTGDFIDDYAVAPEQRNDRSFLFFVMVENRQVRSVRLVPTIIRNCQARIAPDPDAEEIAGKMQALSAEFGTASVVGADNSVTIPRSS
jgi:poly-gamma-glutamate capsule biosynthesis protein CapA/YwtB (metallophosphatase superfamily)